MMPPRWSVSVRRVRFDSLEPSLRIYDDVEVAETTSHEAADAVKRLFADERMTTRPR